MSRIAAAAPPPQALDQAQPLEPYNSFTGDSVLVEAMRREGGAWAHERAGDSAPRRPQPTPLNPLLPQALPQGPF